MSDSNPKKFYTQRASPNNSKWLQLIKRYNQGLYTRKRDIRSNFARDYNRILHSLAYRRLKHKTQVFFAPGNDHICTRMEHVNHVVAVSYTIAHNLGLNTELTNAIAIGHDLGHAPFGHEGEHILKEIAKKTLNIAFWHEGNSLRFVDKIETLPDNQGNQENLALTYAVRDGIVSHCGEVDQNGIHPREKKITLEKITTVAQHQPFTWEGCVVKIADKISYVGRDIEDAVILRILSLAQLKRLTQTLRDDFDISLKDINNGEIIHGLIMDLCESSNPETGIGLSNRYFQLLRSLREFNFENIYSHKRLTCFKSFAKLIIESIFDTLVGFHKESRTLEVVARHEKLYPWLSEIFSDWLIKYSNIDKNEKKKRRYANDIIYNIDSKTDYLRAIIDFISGMTDNFAIKIFEELIRFQ